MPAMIDRIPSGTRDVLPDEMRELRAMTERVRAVFDRAGYGEVATPALEYESTFDRTEMDDSRPAYRVFDEQGNVLVLRADMTSRSHVWSQPATRTPSRRSGSATSRTPIAASDRSEANRGSSFRRASS